MKMKQILAAAIACVMGITGVIPASMANTSAQALESVQENQQIQMKKQGCLEYEILNNGTIEITGFDNSATFIDIPDAIEWRQVTSIGEYAFSDCNSLISITIPDGVTSIGNSAFSKCMSLTSITIPESVTSIGDEAFSECMSLASITIPESVTSIGDEAFSECMSLTSITIPESVTSIGDKAFYSCYSLTSITIPKGVTNIGDKVFSECKSLTSITISEGVTSIGNDAFWNCKLLTSITIPESVMSIGWVAFYGCTALTEIVIKNPNCQLNGIAIPNTTTVYGYNGSTAEEYAKTYDLTFIALDDYTTITTTSTSTTTTTTTTTIQSGEMTTTNKDPLKPLIGDCNLDNAVSVADLVYLNKYLVGIIKFNDQQKINSECHTNGGVIDASDATALLGYCAQQIESLPVM